MCMAALLPFAGACVSSPEAILELQPAEQWAAAESAEQAGDIERAEQLYELIFTAQKIPAAAWRCAALVARLREHDPNHLFAESDDSFRLVPRVLVLAIEGDVATARAGIELLRDRIEGVPEQRGLATLLLGDLDSRAGDHAAAAEKYWSVIAELLMDDYRDHGRRPGSVAAWAALRNMESAVLLDDWLVARRRLGLVDAIALGGIASQFANADLCARVREEFPRWLERVTDANEKRAGVRRQLAARPFRDGIVEQLGQGVVAVESDQPLREVELLLTNGDVLTGVVPEGKALDPNTYVGHGRIDRHDGGIAFGLLDRGRLREGIAIAAVGTFDVVDDFQVQNSVVMRGEKLRANQSISRHTLRVFRTMYEDDRVAVDYFDRKTGRNLQFQWKDLSIVSVQNKALKALSDADREAEIASNERFRRYGPTESQPAQSSSRAFQFNVAPENHTCIKCRGVGSRWRGGYLQQNVWVWQEGLHPGDRRLRNVTLYESGNMETCNWCNGTGRR
jgi:hypothetical protein